MPSEDKYHEENPETNAWLVKEPSIPKFGTPPDSFLASLKEHAASRTEAKQAAFIQALAAKLGYDPEWLASKVPADTLRRLKFSVIEQIDENGLTKFKHDIGIVKDKRTPLLAVDRAHEAIEKGKDGRGAGTDKARSSVTGRFSK